MPTEKTLGFGNSFVFKNKQIQRSTYLMLIAELIW